MDSLRYPIGQFDRHSPVPDDQISELIYQLAILPSKVQDYVSDLSDSDLDRPYRRGGWTLRQVIHHLADSHMNGYIRFRLALTEDRPVIKPYDENLWAELFDAKNYSIQASIQLLEAVHERWVALLKSLSTEDFDREFIHPEAGVTSLRTALALYVWHCNHHGSHLKLGPWK